MVVIKQFMNLFCYVFVEKFVFYFVFQSILFFKRILNLAKVIFTRRVQDSFVH